MSISGSYLGYYPSTPANVNFNYTVLGIPSPLTVTISGNTYITSGQNGTWTAYASGLAMHPKNYRLINHPLAIGI